MARMTGGQAVVECLIAQGVDTVFGIISIHTIHMYDAIRDAVEEGRLKFIGGRHEHALVCMADGYARVTGRPGVLFTSTGPGAADSIGAMGESYHSSIPLVQITTDIEHDWVDCGKGLTHEPKEQLAMFSSVASWCSLVETVGAIPDHIVGALEYQRAHHPRPAVIAIPTDFLAQEAEIEIIPCRELQGASVDHRLIEQMAQMLESSCRPLIWAGGGVMMADACAELREIAERFGAPVVTGDGGKGSFPEDHPLALGTSLGSHVWGPNPLHEYISTRDLVLVVGSSLPYRSTKMVGLKFPSGLIQIDIDPAMLGRNYPVALGLVGDVKVVLGQLLDHIGRSPVVRSPDSWQEFIDLKNDVQVNFQEAFPAEHRLWTGVRSVLDRDAIVIMDSTIPAFRAPRCLSIYEPHTFHSPHGWVSIGYAFAASLGAKAALPGRQVICVTGDGGFQYNLQELATAVQYDLSPVVLLFNDNAWGSLKRVQQTRFEGRDFAVDLQNPDFCDLATVYGIGAVRVESLEQLLDALRRALTNNHIQIIEVAIPDGIVNFW